MLSSRSGSVQPVVIAGGGPAGLAAAMMLSRRGYSNITVLERMSEDEYLKDTDRTYAMALFPRGSAALAEIGFTLDLEEEGVDNHFANRTNIRPDGYDGSWMQTKGKKGFYALEKVAKEARDRGNKTDNFPLTELLKRQTLTRLLYKDLMAKYPGVNAVKMVFDAQVIGCDVDLSKTSASVRYQIASEAAPRTIDAQLVIAADGMNSQITRSIQESDPAFRLIRLTNESYFAGSPKRYKVLALPPSFDVEVTTIKKPQRRGLAALFRRRQPDAPVETTTRLHMSPRCQVVFTPVVPKNESFSFGCFPTTQKHTRVANLNTPPDHPILSLASGEELLRYLERSIPQWRNVREVVRMDEAERFVRKKVGRYGTPQYVNQLHVGRVAFVGDAAHAFPPDLGQGVNAALEDVAILGRCMDGADQLSDALQLYTGMRGPDAAAIAHLAHRWQLLSATASLFRKIRWRGDFFLRLLLSRLLPFLFDPPVYLMITQRELSYAEVWRRARRTSRRLAYVATLVLLALIQAVL
ncbi:unnamed protein product [Vitrella brassicaformis CCMP3155]|uniref:FAD-binding domain-containing protein n=2 Tax=Vitrella brassicaformis TaxID=1169539 RepID=A0A0G4E871_VITBC|nr:unnamed protein product [Vitrella brassicaformis CCMP3155]|eukprot:CEL91728.1 unnamed protein product [Vitrella brassicaformis CCMP3155]